MENYIQVAKEAAIIGGNVLKENFKKLKKSDIEIKGIKDFVTYVDRTSEERIRNYILKNFPEHAFLGEEDGKFGNNDLVWVVDPLDGTKNYICGFEIFAVSVALMDKKTPIVGSIYIPMLDKLYWAAKGYGAYLNGDKIKVSNRSIEQSVVATGFPFRHTDELDNYLKMLKQAMITFSGVRRPGAAAIDLAMVAEGVFDGFFEMKLSLWDIAAGVLLIEEAGGMYSDFEGKKDLSSGNIVAGSKSIYDVLFNIVNQKE